jgi:VWFA-related protein
MLRIKRQTAILLSALMLICLGAGLSASAQTRSGESQGQDKRKSGRDGVRTVIIPVTIRTKSNSRIQRELEVVNFSVREDGEEMRKLSIRWLGNSPLTLSVLIQDGVVSSIGNEMKGVGEFIRSLPEGSRVFVGYIRTGSLEVRQRFTTDLERAANALRPPVSFASAAPSNPYIEIIDSLKRFESQPAGRRAMLVVSDGLDYSRGIDTVSIVQSIDLQRAINEAQRRGVAIYSFYAPSIMLDVRNNSLLAAGAQSSLERLSQETGGRAYFQGLDAPVSFDPYLKDVSTSLTRQLALTYLSTHPNKGFHRIEITTDREDIELSYPYGYTR